MKLLHSKEKKTDENIALNRTWPSTTDGDSRIESRALPSLIGTNDRQKAKGKRGHGCWSVLSISFSVIANFICMRTGVS